MHGTPWCVGNLGWNPRPIVDAPLVIDEPTLADLLDILDDAISAG